MTHTEIDSRSLLLHEQIAAKLGADPYLLRIAENNLSRWERSHAVDPRIITVWREHLALPLAELLVLLVSTDEEAALLRQNSPFAGILGPREVWAIKKQRRHDTDAA